MKMFPREFPSGRRKKPKRQAERRVYEALAATARQGFVYYEWRRGYQCIELDFAVWVEDLGRFALQVKGGHYLLIDGEWHLKTREGLQPVKSCPLDETKLAALDLHDDMARRTGRHTATTRTSFRCWYFRTWSPIRPSKAWPSARACTSSGEPNT